MKINNNLTVRILSLVLPLFLATACAGVDIPEGRSASVPTATPPLDKFEGLNEKRNPVTRVKLGRDVLIPQPLKEDVIPDVMVGPYELRGETLASALQLILDEYDVSLAFETDEGLTRRITVSNLHGKLKDVIGRVCGLANLYCHYEDNTMTIKDVETFVVDLPPVNNTSSGSGSTTASTTTTTSSTTGSSGSGAYTQIADGLKAVIGTTPTVDESSRVLIYTATQRTRKMAEQYFERLRKNTALIIFETHIWEVTLNNQNRTGIRWDSFFNQLGSKFKVQVVLPGAAPTGTATPISITPTYTGTGNLNASSVLQFISERGAVKTVSQPQITVLSGSSATLAVSSQENFVSGVSRTPSTTVGVADTVSTTTSTINTGLTMNVSSAWDQSTVYGTLNIVLDDLLRLDSFTPSTATTIQLPKTTKRSLQTQIRVRPGDAILIGGLVSEKDNFSDSGPGFMTPLFATTRGITKNNTELIFLLRPRVVAFVEGTDEDTVPITDAPQEGVAEKFVPLPDITNSLNGIFDQQEPDPVSDVVDKMKEEKKVEETKPVAVVPSPAPDAEVRKKTIHEQGVNP